MYKRQTISLGYEEPDEMEYSLATLMLNVVNDEKLNMEKTILHHGEGVDLIPANIELSAIEVSLVNAMSRELILRSLAVSYTHLHVNMAQSTNDVIPSAGKLTILALLPGLLEQLERLHKMCIRDRVYCRGQNDKSFYEVQ